MNGQQIIDTHRFARFVLEGGYANLAPSELEVLTQLAEEEARRVLAKAAKSDAPAAAARKGKEWKDEGPTVATSKRPGPAAKKTPPAPKDASPIPVPHQSALPIQKPPPRPARRRNSTPSSTTSSSTPLSTHSLPPSPTSDESIDPLEALDASLASHFSHPPAPRSLANARRIVETGQPSRLAVVHVAREWNQRAGRAWMGEEGKMIPREEAGGFVGHFKGKFPGLFAWVAGEGPRTRQRRGELGGRDDTEGSDSSSEL
ncbi:hypothetical protein DFJ74DRAFT_759867 [Hyaloraphidium curvatum]|nr:hypothetical protein DFJ74DRAFT_759867 [Hyaloraphidium curvatum]